LDTEDWLHCNGHSVNPNDSEDDCAGDTKCDIEHNYGIEDTEYPEQQVVMAAPPVPGLVRPKRMSKRQAEKLFVMVNVIETRRNKEVKKKYVRLREWFTSLSLMLDQYFQLEKH
jgi:hypothetical protein